MKKCYIVPNVKVESFEISSTLCETSPFTGTQDTTEADNSGTAGSDMEMEGRQRGGDFGSLW